MSSRNSYPETLVLILGPRLERKKKSVTFTTKSSEISCLKCKSQQLDLNLRNGINYQKQYQRYSFQTHFSTFF